MCWHNSKVVVEVNEKLRSRGHFLQTIFEIIPKFKLTLYDHDLKVLPFAFLYKYHETIIRTI